MKVLKEKLQLSKTIQDVMNHGDKMSVEEGIQKELDIPKFMNVQDLRSNNVEVIRRDNSEFKIPSFLSNRPDVVKIANEPPMTQGYMNKLTERVQAMTTGEKIVVAEALPVDICIDRIKTENKKQQLFVDSIKKSFSILDINTV